MKAFLRITVVIGFVISLILFASAIWNARVTILEWNYSSSFQQENIKNICSPLAIGFGILVISTLCLKLLKDPEL